MKVIGVGGYARCGKDTFVAIAKQILEKNGYETVRVAFADKLKDEVQQMLDSNKFSLFVRSNDSEEKKKFRPLLVWWGCERRDESEGGLYWVNEVDKSVRILEQKYNGNSDRVVAFVSDVRFPNEAKWVHEKWGGAVIHLTRWSMKMVTDGYGDKFMDKVYDAAPNEEEAKQDPLVKEMADYRLEWESRGIPAGCDVLHDEYLQEKVLEALNSIKFFKHQTIGTLSL